MSRIKYMRATEEGVSLEVTPHPRQSTLFLAPLLGVFRAHKSGFMRRRILTLLVLLNISLAWSFV